MAQRLNNSETLKDRPRSERLQKIRRETIKKAFEKDPELKMTRLTQKPARRKADISTLFASHGLFLKFRTFLKINIVSAIYEH